MSIPDRRRERKLDGAELDRSPGNGSGSYRDEGFDHENPDDVYDATPAETTFKSWEGDDVVRSDGSRVDFSELFRHHHGTHPESNDSTDHDERKRQKTVEDTCEIVAGHVELTDVQFTRMTRYLDVVDFSEAGSISTEQMVLAAATVAANKDDRWIRRETDFRRLMDEYRVTNDDVKTARRHLHDHVL